jgi:hypothetical protein
VIDPLQTNVRREAELLGARRHLSGHQFGNSGSPQVDAIELDANGGGKRAQGIGRGMVE